MRRTLVILFVVISIAILVIACGGQPISSKEEAAYFAYSQPDFKEMISIESVRGNIYSLCKESSNKTENFCVGARREESLLSYVLHIVRYKDTKNNIVTLYLNEDRPPKKIDTARP